MVVGTQSQLKFLRVLGGFVTSLREEKPDYKLTNGVFLRGRCVLKIEGSILATANELEENKVHREKISGHAY